MANPTSLLYLRKANASGDVGITIENQSINTSVNTASLFLNPHDKAWGSGASIVATNMNNPTNSRVDLSFNTNTTAGSLTEKMRITSEGAVGIGTTTPWAVFAVNPIVGASTSSAFNQFVVGSSTATSFIIDNNGRVGVGTTTPGATFAVQGNPAISANGFALFGGNGTSGTSGAAGGNGIVNGGNGGNGSGNVGGAGGALTFISGNGGSAAGGAFTAGSGGNVTIIAGDGGNGSGTNGNGGTIYLYPGVKGAGAGASANNGNILLAVNAAGIQRGNVGISTSSPQATLAVNPIAGGAAAQFVVGSSTYSSFYINNQGAVGIGSTTPFAMLSVNAQANRALNQFAVGSSTATAFIINNQGNVGIGTTTPGSIFAIGGSNGINFSITATSTFNGTGGISIASGCFAVNGVCLSSSSYGDTNVNAYVNSSSTIAKTYSNNAFIGTNTFTGNVGIGTTTTPGQILSLYEATGAVKIGFNDSTATRFVVGTDASNNENFNISTGSALGAGNDMFTILANITPTTSYANPGGTGSRGGLITVTDSGSLFSAGSGADLVDGSMSIAAYFNNSPAAGKWIQFDFGSSKLITEATFYKNAAGSDGTWKWQGSNDASTWTDIGNPFTFGGVTTQVMTELSGNSAGYRYYRMLGLSGNVGYWGTAYEVEIEFKIASYAGSGQSFVGIHNNAPGAALEVKGWGSTTGLSFNVKNLSNTNLLTVLDNGKVGIGSTTPSQTFSVVGTVAMNGLSASGATDQNVCINTTTKELTFGTSCIGSSQRFKHNIETLDDEKGLDLITKLRPVSFTYNENNADSLGFIAEEVNELEPRLVFYEADGTTPKGVRYENFAPVIVKSIQELDLNLNAVMTYSSTSIATSSAQTFAAHFVQSLLQNVSNWLADAGNGLVNIFTKKVTTEELCIGDSGDSVCVTKDQLKNLLNNTNTHTTPAPVVNPVVPPTTGGDTSEPEVSAPPQDAPVSTPPPVEEISVPPSVPSEAPVETNPSPTEEVPSQ